MSKAAAGLAIVVVLVAARAPFAQGQDSEIPLGTPLPGQDITLLSESGSQVTLAKLKGKNATVVLFWSNRCPWTSKYEDRISKLYNDLGSEDNVFLLVNSNDGSAFPDENAQASARYLSDHRLAAHYLTDAKSQLAKAFGATRAPHVFIFDKNATLVYVGAVDDSPGDPGRVQKEYVREALTALAAGRQVDSPQTKAFGCMIRFVR